MGGLHWILLYQVAVLAVSISATVETSDLVEVRVDDETFQYSLSSNPPVDSPVVQAEKDNLRGTLDLESFVKDLGRVGKYVRVAYNGIGAAGPKFVELQIGVQRLGFDISNLCDKSAVTIAGFKTATRDVLFELRSAYQFLLKNRENLALGSFSIIAELAGKMAAAAEQLQREFELQDLKVSATLEETKRAGAKEEIRVSDLRAEQEKTIVNIKIQEDLAKEHRKLEEEARAEKRRYERKEDKAMHSKSGFLSRLGNVVTSYFGLGNLFDDSSAASKASRYRQKSIEKLEVEKEQRKQKQEALQMMARLVHDIKAMGEERDLSEVAIKALHEASGSMKQLVHLLKQAVLFWTHLKNHCQRLADDKLRQRIKEYVQELTEEERREYWTSSDFKERMFLFISKWVALHSVSSDYLETIKLTQRDLYNFITENPTHEESRRNLQELADNFEEDLKSAQEEIEKRNIKADKEIQQLIAEEKIGKTEL
jgi:flagellar hook-basal body complex protein FliE